MVSTSLFFIYTLLFSSDNDCNVFFQGTPVNIIVGSHVWAEDPEDAWIDGQVTEIHGKNATIIATNGKIVSIYNPYARNTAHKHN